MDAIDSRLRAVSDGGKRGNSVSLSSEWFGMLKSLHDEVKAGGVTQEEFGALLANASGRAKPFRHDAVSRFLSGEVVTDEIVSAFSALFEIPYPIMCARSVDEVAVWRDLQALRDHAPKAFDQAAREISTRLKIAKSSTVPSSKTAAARARIAAARVGSSKPGDET